MIEIVYDWNSLSMVMMRYARDGSEGIRPHVIHSQSLPQNFERIVSSVSWLPQS